VSFENKVILITGGTSGLGEAAAKAFAAHQTKVIFCGLDDKDGRRVLSDLKAIGAQAVYQHADVRVEADMQALVQTAMSRWGQLDIAFNNAGISHSASRFADMDPAQALDVFQTNVMGIWYAMRHQIPAMASGGGGAIVNTASILSKSGAEWMSAYGMSKHGVVGLTRSAALDHAKDGVRINALSPGPMDTPMFERAMLDIGEDTSKFAGGIPKGGPADPQDVAQTVLYLAGDGAKAITGANFVVDGGISQG